jgi:hypothetical protein
MKLAETRCAAVLANTCNWLGLCVIEIAHVSPATIFHVRQALTVEDQSVLFYSKAIRVA